MDLLHLYKMQEQLDRRICREHKLEGENLLPSKILALQVELGELANESRCFKFWSNKGASSRENILEEYVDCLHFILSIGLDSNMTEVHIKKLDNNNSLVEQFQNIFTYIARFEGDQILNNYEDLFNHFLLLGRKLNFTEEEIYKAYIEKNKINHRRQDQGY